MSSSTEWIWRTDTYRAHWFRKVGDRTAYLYPPRGPGDAPKLHLTERHIRVIPHPDRVPPLDDIELAKVELTLLWDETFDNRHPDDRE